MQKNQTSYSFFQTLKAANIKKMVFDNHQIYVSCSANNVKILNLYIFGLLPVNRNRIKTRQGPHA